MRVFLDANVLFSAAKSDGPVRRLLKLAIAEGHELWADSYVAEEARRNIAAKAPDASSTLDDLLTRIHVATVQLHIARSPAVDVLPEKDRPVLAAAIRLECDVLVTGDRTHFGKHFGRKLAGVMIHSPRSLAQAILR